MRTAIIIAAGFALLAACYFIGRALGKPPASGTTLGLWVFIGLWLVAAGVNMWIGVSTAGYSVREEFPIFLVIFGVPAAAAAYLLWR